MGQCVPSQGAPKCLPEAGCLPRVAKASLLALLLPCACPKALLCLEGACASSDQKSLDLAMFGGLVEMEDTFLGASSGGF